MESGRPLHWDVFCRVVDNYGDIGVCWRLARRLAGAGDTVRLWVDDASALAFMAPAGARGVDVRAWSDPGPGDRPGDVVVEAFGCDPPEAFVQRMAEAPRPPVWINLEYLSAEAEVERNHALRSPQRNGLDKWFFYPGFSARTGGLIREPDYDARRAAFDPAAWLDARGLAPRAGTRLASLFCYGQPALPTWSAWLAARPTTLLLTPGHAVAQASALAPIPGLATAALPWLTQDGYDELLWACDLNFVRGEDSVVRALWSGRPFVWQIYPQSDGVHRDKLEAFLDRYLDGAPAPLAARLRQAQHHWSGTGPPPRNWPDIDAWAAHARAVSDAWAREVPELGDSLKRFARDRGAGPPA